MSTNELKEAINKLFDSTVNDSILEIPNSKDKLFTANSDFWHLNACINQPNNFDAYCTGYLDAAKLLARIVIFSGRRMDTLIYPIAFLYRHYVELILKDFIRRGNLILEKEIDQKTEEALNQHGLSILWNKLKPIFYEILKDEAEYDKVEKGIESYINQINQIDPGSFAFRYDKSKTGENNLEQIEHINVLSFCQNIEKLTDLFEGIDMQLDFILDSIVDMRSDYMDDVYGY